MINLNRTKNPINREGRTDLNENWLKIEQAFRNLLEQIKFLAGGEDVEELIRRIEIVINDAQTGANDARQAVQSVTDALSRLDVLITNTNASADRADVATDEANAMNVILNHLKDELEGLQADLTGIVQAEAQRVTSESERGTAEQGRDTAEITRRENEASRVLKEQARDTAEQNRATTFNTKMLTAEEKITMMRDLIDNLRSYAYEADATYDFPNLVAWNGNTFIALQEVTGVTPTDDGINYRLVAQRGVDGTGAVSSVNGVSPTPDGNVQINLDVINNITSDITDQGLSAAMGKFLKSLIDTLAIEKVDAAFVDAEVNRLIAAAPGMLDTFEEIANALNNDPNFANTIINLLNDKASNAALGQTNESLAQTNNNLSTLQQEFATHKDNYNKNTCILAMGGLQVLTSGYAARLELNIARVDNNQMTTTGIEPLVRIKEDGWYLINMQSSFTFNDNGIRQISFTVNDTDDYENSCTTRGTDIINTTVHFNKRIYLRANDVIKCYAMQNSGVSLNCFNTVLSVGMVG